MSRKTGVSSSRCIYSPPCPQPSFHPSDLPCLALAADSVRHTCSAAFAKDPSAVSFAVYGLTFGSGRNIPWSSSCGAQTRPKGESTDGRLLDAVLLDRKSFAGPRSGDCSPDLARAGERTSTADGRRLVVADTSPSASPAVKPSKRERAVYANGSEPKLGVSGRSSAWRGSVGCIELDLRSVSVRLDDEDRRETCCSIDGSCADARRSGDASVDIGCEPASNRSE